MEKALKNYMQDNVIYTNQYAIMAFIVMIVFKIAMLPSYMYQTVGRDSWFVIAVLMAIECAMFMLVLYVSKRINLLFDDNKWLIGIHLIIYVYAMIRLMALFSGLAGYTSTSLFDQGRTGFIVVSFVVVIPYIASKGGNTVARLFEMVFYFLVAMLLIMLFTPNFKADFGELLPILRTDGGKMISGFTDYSVWFGDFIPMLYFVVKDNKNKIMAKVSPPFAVISAAIGVVVFYIMFIAVYGEAGGMVYFAFNRMSVFNTLSKLLGATNFLSILVWMIMSILQITLIFLTAVNALSRLIKNRILAIIINAVAVCVLQLFVFKNIEIAHNFATGGVKYFVMACELFLPIGMWIYTLVKTKKEKV